VRFWQKIFFSSLVIFIIIFNAGAWVITSHSYDFNLQRETGSAVREHGVILSSVLNGISNAEKIMVNASKSNVNLFAVIEPLAAYYAPQGIHLALFNDGAPVYSLGFDVPYDLLFFPDESVMNIADRKIEDVRNLFVSSKIPEYEHLIFVYVRNINELDVYRTEIGNMFLWLNIAVCTVLGISIFLLLKHMTRPIKKLNEITNQIAGGAYEKRVNIQRNDELGELSRTFNTMADSVETNMNKKQQFIDNLSHEIKTPVTAILGYSDFLLKTNSDKKSRALAAEHLHDAAERLNQLSSKLLDITFLRREQIDFKTIDISKLFSSFENLIRPSLTERKLNLKTIAEVDSISGDETLIISLLTNLVENAARASLPNSTITVKAYSKGNPVIEVQDTGCGMDAQELDKITEPFYRVDKSRSRSFGGAGLGLGICKLIADLHGAKLEVISKPSAGTTVKIIFYNSITT